jgi:hypothetical protein
MVMTYDIQMTDRSIYVLSSVIVFFLIARLAKSSDASEKEENLDKRIAILKSYYEVGLAAGLLDQGNEFEFDLDQTEEMLEFHKGYYEGLRRFKKGDIDIALEKRQ